MSQSDLSIANVSRSLFRQEVNEALQALGSLSSGATEPTTTYAYQLWADTGSGLLKQRNAANDGWINKGNLADVDWGLLNKAGGTMTGLLNLAAGADIASASTVDLTAATGNCPKITGTTDIEAWTMNTGQQMKCIAGGAFKLVYDATTNNVEGGADYTCATGDIINLVKGLDGVVRVRIDKQNGTPVVPVQFASSSDFNTGTDETKAINSKIARENAWVYGSLIPTTSGDPIEILTGLPAWVTEIEIFLDRISCSGTNNILVQQRIASGYVVTGYSSNSANALNSNVASASSTTGYLIRQTDASYDYICYIKLSKGDGDIWFSNIMCRRSDGGVVWGAGNVDLGGDCTGVRIDTDGSNTFDNGSAIGRYR